MIPKSDAEVTGTRQHYISQEYLRAWAVDPINRSDIVHVFQLRDGKQRQSNTMNVCVEKGYWDYIGTDGLKHSYDLSLGTLEEPTLEALQHFLSNPTTGELQLAKPSIAYLAALFLLSNPGYRQNVQHLVSATNDAYGTQAANVDDESMHHHHISVIARDLHSVSETLQLKYWVLVHNYSNMPYWTSDAPIAITNAKNRSIHLIEGSQEIGIVSNVMLLRDPEAIAWFPLSPTLLLMLVSSTQNRYYPSEVCALDERIAFANGQQVYSANRYVFSNGADFAWAETLWRDDPRLQAEPRQRFTIAKLEAA